MRKTESRIEEVSKALRVLEVDGDPIDTDVVELQIVVENSVSHAKQRKNKPI